MLNNHRVHAPRMTISCSVGRLWYTSPVHEFQDYLVGRNAIEDRIGETGGHLLSTTLGKVRWQRRGTRCYIPCNRKKEM
jgi:hypothetical protein